MANKSAFRPTGPFSLVGGRWVCVLVLMFVLRRGIAQDIDSIPLITPKPIAHKSTMPQGIDSDGNSIKDPTENVQALNEAANKRQDDLRELNNHYLKALIDAQKDFTILRANHNSEIGSIRAEHQKELNKAEADRLNSIRQVDREEVIKTAAAAQLAIQALAKDTTTLAETLRTQVTNTANAAEARLTTFNADVNKRISTLELASSERLGKLAVSDPASERLAQTVEKLLTQQTTGAGKSEGINSTVAMIISGAFFIISLVTLFFRFQSRT